MRELFAGFWNRQPGRPGWRILWWHVLHLLCFVWFMPMYRYRAWGIHHIPRTGPVLLVSNHQSLFDPILVGLGGHHRQFYAMARATLFRSRAFGWLIRSLNAVPVEREGGGDLKAMRGCVDVLKQGHGLLIFPEGTRTPDGSVRKFAPGTMLMIKRAKPVVVPVAIAGAFEVWPRKAKAPHPTGRIGVQYGEPIAAEELLAMPGDETLEMLRERIDAMRRGMRRARSTEGEAVPPTSDQPSAVSI